MIVRIKLRVGPQVTGYQNLDAKLALAMAALLTPAAVLCVVIGLWRLLADLNVTEEFVIRRGLLSHWQVWMALATALQLISTYLNRYGQRFEREG
jgi:hypothetical protein